MSATLLCWLTGWTFGSICLIWNRRVASYYRENYPFGALLEPPLLVTYRVIVALIGIIAFAMGTAACVSYLT